MLKDYPAEPKYYPGRGPAGCKHTLVIWTKHFAHAKTIFESVMNRNTRLVCEQQSQIATSRSDHAVCVCLQTRQHTCTVWSDHTLCFINLHSPNITHRNCAFSDQVRSSAIWKIHALFRYTLKNPAQIILTVNRENSEGLDQTARTRHMPKKHVFTWRGSVV